MLVSVPVVPASAGLLLGFAAGGLRGCGLAGLAVLEGRGLGASVVRRRCVVLPELCRFPLLRCAAGGDRDDDEDEEEVVGEEDETLEALRARAASVLTLGGAARCLVGVALAGGDCGVDSMVRDGADSSVAGDASSVACASSLEVGWEGACSGGGGPVGASGRGRVGGGGRCAVVTFRPPAVVTVRL